MDDAREMRVSEVEEILELWFGREGEEGYGEFREVWMSKDPTFDQEIRDRFLPVYEKAAASELDGWAEEPRSCLALVLVLDQFGRHIFRGNARMYAADEKGLSVARQAIRRGFDREFVGYVRTFFYLPFMHSERVEDQRRCVELLRRHGEEGGGPGVSPGALRHLEVIERFGRFPHRNEVLGRETTPEEAEFLKEPNSSF